MKKLLVYYSLSGNNKALANKLYDPRHYDLLCLEEETKRNIFSIVLGLVFKRKPRLKKYSIDISSYDHVVLIAPVWAGRVATPMEGFIRLERENLKTYSFITLCGGVAGQKEKLAASLLASVGKKPIALEELWVSDILTEQEKNLNHVGAYKIKDADWGQFERRIAAFESAASFSKTPDPCLTASVSV